MTGYNTGTVAGTGGSVASQAVTIPGGVLAGDTVFLLACCFQISGSVTVSAASTGTAPQQLAGSPQLGGSGNTVRLGAWWFPASGTDAGKVITVTPSATCFVSLALASYSGFDSSPVDVSGGNADASTLLTSWSCPAETTVRAADWGVYMCAAGVNSAGITVPGGTTSRQNANFNGGVAAVICDTAGSVGGAGTGIGNAAFTGSVSNNWTAVTVGLATLSLVSPGGAADRHHHRALAGRPGQHRPGGRGGHR